MGTNAQIGSSDIVEADNPAATDGFALVEFLHPIPSPAGMEGCWIAVQNLEKQDLAI
jgi:hypothetical protein